MNRQATLKQALGSILDTLIADYKPKKVILFGSMASGRIKERSDLDLVVIKDTAKPFIRRSEEVALLCMAPVGVDYLVYTPQEFQRMTTEENPFIVEEVLKKSKPSMSAPLSEQWLDTRRDPWWIALWTTRRGSSPESTRRGE